MTAMIAMNHGDVQLMIAAHKREPRQVTTVAVALAMHSYRSQIGVPLRPSDLMAALGISDSMARRAVRLAKALAAPLEPEEGRNSDVPIPQTNRNGAVPAERRRSGTATFRKPERQRSENGTSAFRLKEKKEQHGTVQCGRNSDVPIPQTSDDEPFLYPDPPPQPPGPPGSHSIEADTLAAWAERFGNGNDDEPIATVARSLCNHYRADWIELAIRRKDEWGERLNRRILTTVLRAWEKRGEPEPRFLAEPPTRDEASAARAAGTVGARRSGPDVDELMRRLGNG